MGKPGTTVVLLLTRVRFGRTDDGEFAQTVGALGGHPWGNAELRLSFHPHPVGQIRRLRRTDKEGLYAYDQCHVAVEGLSLD